MTDDVRQLRLGSITVTIPAALLAIAAAGWWWTARMTGSMGAMDGMGSSATAMDRPGALGPFLVAWVVMMAAMMFPAVWPATQFYARAATAGRVAAVPAFVAGYLVVWTATGLPGYVAWRLLGMPTDGNLSWQGPLAGVVLVAAGAWQFSGLKTGCLTHCRSPISFFMQHTDRTRDARGAFTLGAHHGLYCLGCCWALMAVLVAMGTMHLGWMAGLSVLILAEKVLPGGPAVGRVAGVGFVFLGGALALRPDLLTVVS